MDKIATGYFHGVKRTALYFNGIAAAGDDAGVSDQSSKFPTVVKKVLAESEHCVVVVSVHPTADGVPALGGRRPFHSAKR